MKFVIKNEEKIKIKSVQKKPPKESLLERRIERHINPERSRRFEPERWERSRRFLSELAKEDWLSSQGQLRMHIVGSNGKGSLAWYLSELLHKLYGLSPAGLFTSPHLLSAHERLRFNGKAISDADACRGLSSIEEHLGTKAFQELSYFELLTILMLYESTRRSCPVLILEAGLGGRLDATRMAQGEAVVLTPICLEHTGLLGNSYEEILQEKLGIITQNTRYLFLPPEPGFALEFSKKKLLPVLPEGLQKNLELIKLSQKTRKGPINSFPNSLKIIQNDAPLPDSLKLEQNRPASPQASPNYLAKNLHRAQEILEYLEAVYPSLLNHKATDSKLAAPPGRLEVRTYSIRNSIRNSIGDSIKEQGGFGELAFDAAHNPDALRQSLLDFSHLLKAPLENYILVLGILKDRPLESCLAVFQEFGLEKRQIVVLTGPERAQPSGNSGYRSMSEGELLLFAESLTKKRGSLERNNEKTPLQNSFQNLFKRGFPPKGFILLGSHRNYALFERLATSLAASL